MTPRTIKINTVEKTNAKILAEFEGDYTYDAIRFSFRNTGAANVNAPALNTLVSDVVARMNGQDQRTFTVMHGAALNALFGAKWAPQGYAGNTLGIPNVNGEGRTHFVILFREPRSRFKVDSVDVGSLGWKTRWLPKSKPLQVEMTNVLGANLDVEVEAVVRDDDDSDVKGPNRIVKWYSHDNILAANPTTLNNWAKNFKDGDRFLQMSLFNSSGGKFVTQARLEAGGGKFYEDVSKPSIFTELLGADLDPAGADAQAVGFHMALDRYEDINDGLPNFNSSLLRVWMSAAANGESLISVTQRYGFPDGFNG
jgi:hypothetical protein